MGIDRKSNPDRR